MLMTVRSSVRGRCSVYDPEVVLSMGSSMLLIEIVHMYIQYAFVQNKSIKV